MGNINIKWVVIGIVFLILIVALGRSPIEEHRKAEEEAKKGKNMLIESINEHNSGGSSRMNLGVFGLGGSKKDSDSSSGRANSRVITPAPAESTRNYPSPARPADSADNANTAPEPQGYYPPPPLAGTGVAVR